MRLDDQPRGRNISDVEQQFQVSPATGTAAIDRGADLLVRVLESPEPAALTDLAKAAGIPKSTASRLLSALERRGFLEVETPLGENTGLALAGRRSNIDFVYSSLVPKDTFSVVAAPVYYDYQGILSHRFGPHHRLRVLRTASRLSTQRCGSLQRPCSGTGRWPCRTAGRR